ncbi:hypothetical protein FHX69_2624 [Prauserella muralis]|nr:hypothetical protein FHX69_2624 [Prauserella muralis]
MSGPAPDPNALRRDRPSDQAGWVTLPREGSDAPAPTWPLEDPTDREHDLWDDMWTRPQAVMWAALSQEYEVALFVRMLALAEQPGGSVERQKVVRQYLDSLGLSVQGMLRNRWRIADAAPASTDEGPAPSRASTGRRPSARERMRVVNGGA